VTLRRTLPLLVAPLLVLAVSCGDDDDSPTDTVGVTAVSGTGTTMAAPGTTTNRGDQVVATTEAP
jgi:hypothetical protein